MSDNVHKSLDTIKSLIKAAIKQFNLPENIRDVFIQKGFLIQEFRTFVFILLNATQIGTTVLDNKKAISFCGYARRTFFLHIQKFKEVGLKKIGINIYDTKEFFRYFSEKEFIQQEDGYNRHDSVGDIQKASVKQFNLPENIRDVFIQKGFLIQEFRTFMFILLNSSQDSRVILDSRKAINFCGYARSTFFLHIQKFKEVGLKKIGINIYDTKEFFRYFSTPKQSYLGIRNEGIRLIEDFLPKDASTEEPSTREMIKDFSLGA